MIKKCNVTVDNFKQKFDLNYSSKKMSIYNENHVKNNNVLIADDRVLQKGGRQLSFENTHENMSYLFGMPIIYW